MTLWWKHHESELPKFTDNLWRAEIFLGIYSSASSTSFQFGQRDFSAVENDFLPLQKLSLLKIIYGSLLIMKGERLYSE
jgi:hypothetical protein